MSNDISSQSDDSATGWRISHWQQSIGCGWVIRVDFETDTSVSAVWTFTSISPRRSCLPSRAIHLPAHATDSSLLLHQLQQLTLWSFFGASISFHSISVHPISIRLRTWTLSWTSFYRHFPSRIPLCFPTQRLEFNWNWLNDNPNSY